MIAAGNIWKLLKMLKKAGFRRMKVIIKEAKILRANEVWKKHKPQGIGFGDTDIVIISWGNGGRLFEQDFYCRLKADGTLGHSITKQSEKRQKDLQLIIRRYISKEKNYNVRARINEWKGKKVELAKVDGVYIIEI